jgi:hypothetical protein
MGMEHHQGPRRRRVGVEDPSRNVQYSLWLSHLSAALIDRLRQPGILHPQGCSKGDVIEVAIRELYRKRHQPGLAKALYDSSSRKRCNPRPLFDSPPTSTSTSAVV